MITPAELNFKSNPDFLRSVQDKSWSIHEWALLFRSCEASAAGINEQVLDRTRDVGEVINALFASVQDPTTREHMRSLILESVARSSVGDTLAATPQSSPTTHAADPLVVHQNVLLLASNRSSPTTVPATGAGPVTQLNLQAPMSQQPQAISPPAASSSPTQVAAQGVTGVGHKRRRVEKVCRMCGTTQTTEWRRGPDGTKSLCNNCGRHFASMLKREQLHVVKATYTSAISSILN